MKNCDLDTGASRLVRGMKDLHAVWEEASGEWNDEVSAAVFKDHIEPMTPIVKSALDAIGRMRNLLLEAQRDLEG